ncbi:DUF3558 domain-containing protein [Nocardia sp. SC052]|uniref:DUF3558 domain-containing protein n=1 Tax=Nocardia sichangensis TaxID=3385975 RepID=UPI0039A3BF0C
MSGMRTPVQLTALTAGAVFVLTGCGLLVGGNSQPTGNATTTGKPSVAADVPSGYDTCKDIPQSVLDSEKLRRRDRADSDASGGIKWRGCRYGRTDGYFATITTTNITVAMTRAKNFADAAEFTVNGREALTTRQTDGNRDEACVANVAMNGGSLDVSVLNPASNRDTGQIDSCVIARILAEKIVPTMPANA